MPKTAEIHSLYKQFGQEFINILISTYKIPACAGIVKGKKK